MKKIFILGATGSVGKNCLEVIKSNPNELTLVGFTYYNNQKLAKVISKKYKTKNYFSLKSTSVENFCKMIIDSKPDYILHATPGINGYEYLSASLGHCLNHLVANKESIIMFEPLIRPIQEKFKANIIPIDSEHTSLLDLLSWSKIEVANIKNIYLTCSGGSFRNINDLATLKTKKYSDFLNHPTWKMGDKITIDSATLFNKLFEILEAKFYLDIPIKKIKPIIHHQSKVHAIIEFQNGSMRISASSPNMQLAIAQAINLNNYLSIHNAQPINLLESINFQPFNLYQQQMFSLVKYFDKPFIGILLNAINDQLIEELSVNNANICHFYEITNKILSTKKYQRKIANNFYDYRKYYFEIRKIVHSLLNVK